MSPPDLNVAAELRALAARLLALADCMEADPAAAQEPLAREAYRPETPPSGGGGGVGRAAAGGGSGGPLPDAPLVWLILSTPAGFHKPRWRRLRPRQAPDAAAGGSRGCIPILHTGSLMV